MKHEFVDQVPAELEDGVLYVSIKYATVIHLCACGCRNEVVTPLSPAEWRLTFDGKSISLFPSIGNWSLPCRSHYWIVKDSIRWARKWTEREIDAAREQDRVDRDAFYSEGSSQRSSTEMHGKRRSKR